MPSCITHVSVNFDDIKALDADISEGFVDFTLYPEQDLGSPDGVTEITIIEANIRSDSSRLVIQDIPMKLFEDYNLTGRYIILNHKKS